MPGRRICSVLFL
jgi:hypothetical protein